MALQKKMDIEVVGESFKAVVTMTAPELDQAHNRIMNHLSDVGKKSKYPNNAWGAIGVNVEEAFQVYQEMEILWDQLVVMMNGLWRDSLLRATFNMSPSLLCKAEFFVGQKSAEAARIGKKLGFSVKAFGGLQIF